MSMLHLRYDGQSRDIALDELDIGNLSSDRNVKEALANFLQVPIQKLNNFAVDRSGEEITVRPEATFG